MGRREKHILRGMILMLFLMMGRSEAIAEWGKLTLYDISWYKGHESDAEYEISTPLQYGGLVALVNWENNMKAEGYEAPITFEGKTIHVVNDIDLSENYARPIADVPSKEFRGTIDGLKADGTSAKISNLKTISAIAGMFGSLNKATIKNLILVGGSHNGTKGYAGTIGAIAKNSTFENVVCDSIKVDSIGYGGGLVGVADNCKVNGVHCNSVSVNTKYYSGGVAGYGLSSSSFENCSSYGNITGSNDAGGIVGHSRGCNIINCFVGNESISMSITAANAGGIAGYATSESKFETCKVKNVTVDASNSGGVIGMDNGSSILNATTEEFNVKAYNNAGGVVGSANNSEVDGTTVNKSEIQCTNYYGGYAGGIIGSGYGSITKTETDNATVVQGNNAGGIFGATVDQVTLQSCINRAEIGPYKERYGSVFGGIIGKLSINGKSASIISCINEGKLVPNDSQIAIPDVGGLIGLSENFTLLSISNCQNTGKIQINGDHIGGGIGSIKNNNTTGIIRAIIKSFTNESSITGYFSGGVLGYAKQNMDSSIELVFEECANDADILGYDYAGGISGYLGYDVADLLQGNVGQIGYIGMIANYTDCRNRGNVEGKIAGGISGEVFHGFVDHSFNNGRILCRGNVNNTYAGGLIGVNDRADIINSANYGAVSGNTGTNATGGLVGYNFTSFIRNSYNKADVSDGSYSAGITGVFGKDFAGETSPLEYSNITNAYSSGKITGTDPTGVTHTWHENFDTGYWSKAGAEKGLGVYDKKVYQNPKDTVAGYVRNPEDTVTKVQYDNSFTEIKPVTTSKTLLETLEYETQKYNRSNSSKKYLHWVKPIKNPSPFGITNDYPVFGYPIVFKIFTDGIESDVGGSIGSTDARQIVDYFNGGNLEDYFAAHGEDVHYSAMAKKGYVFEKSTSNDVILNQSDESLDNGFTMEATTTNEDAVVVNLFFVSQYTVTISKIWNDRDDEDLKRPDDISVSLKIGDEFVKDKNGVDVKDLKLVENADGKWQTTVILPAGSYDDMNITEGNVDGYTLQTNRVTTSGHDISAVLVNCPVPTPKNREITEFRVYKEWIGIDGEPPEISLQLFDNNVKLEDKPVMRDNWYIWKLPIARHDHIPEYYVLEESMSGFITEYLHNGELTDCARNGDTIRNTKVPPTGDEHPILPWVIALTVSSFAIMVWRRRK